MKQCADRMLEVVVEDNGIGRIRAAEINGAEMLSQKSYGMRITRDRLYMISNTYQADADVSVEDLALKDGSAGGTRVTVHIPFRHIATKGVV
ncbi:MAG: hypothetical protein EOP49_18100 [Sphingobacteriales bacterium]|nr:MAG: hypothetical protein EOP49_18100 [Sphingobacteriales bacterium]